MSMKYCYIKDLSPEIWYNRERVLGLRKVDYMTAELQKYFRSAKASVEMEGFEVTEQMEKLIMKRQSGAISNEEFRNKALRMAGI